MCNCCRLNSIFFHLSNWNLHQFSALDGGKQVVWGCSQSFHFATLTPPEPPGNFRVADSSCGAMRLAWSRPVDADQQIIGNNCH